MVIVNRAAEPGFQYMGVNLRCRDIGMAEHGLYATQVRSAFQEVCRKAVPDHVGRQPLPDTGILPIDGQLLPE